MATVINLKVKDEQGNITNQKHEIEEITLFQFSHTMKVIKAAINELKDDNELKDFLNTAFGADFDMENVSEEKLAKLDQDFLMSVVGAFEALFVKLPDKATEILSALSGIDKNVLGHQKFNDVLDIYDAVMEENDIEKLVKRVKKSLVGTIAKLKFVKKVKEVTSKE